MKFAEDFRGALGITLASARANLVPMAVLWALAGVSVGAYYLLTPFREMLEPVVEWLLSPIPEVVRQVHMVQP